MVRKLSGKISDIPVFRNYYISENEPVEDAGCNNKAIDLSRDIPDDGLLPGPI